MRPCPRPPSKDKIIELVNFYLKGYGLAQHIRPDASPDVEWMLVCISSFDPNCFIFQKGYLPNKEELRVKKQSVAIKTIKNFFEGLPEEQSSRKVEKSVMRWN